jgi:hypothetical protein
MKKTKATIQKKPKTQRGPLPDRLTGWSAIAAYLGQTPAVAQRWHESGMPVERHGRRVSASREELTRWVGTEAGKSKPIHIAEKQEDLLSDLKAGLAYARRGKGGKN